MKTKKENKELPQSMLRLQQFFEHQHLTLYQVNKVAGLSTGLLQNAYAKKQGLTISTVEAILNAFPQLNANWLIVGRGEMLLDVEPSAVSSHTVTQQHIDHLDTLQQQCVSLIKTIQQMKQQEQADADARLLDSLLSVPK